MSCERGAGEDPLEGTDCSEAAPESLRDRVRLQLREVRIQITEGGS